MPYSPAAGIVIDQRARYERLWGALTKRQAALAASAMADVEAELMKAKQGSWTTAMAAATLAQLGEATRGLSESQLRLLSRALPGIAGIAKDDLADYLGKLDEHYLGVARPLRWDALEWLEGYSRPLLRSRLRVYEKSFARYGAEAVAGIESSMAKSVLLGTPWTEARESVMALVREQVGGRQWMVDRIIRTEVATVYSSTTMAALLEEDEPDDPMLKKLVAIWDKVTGLDSKILHGQTRRVQDLFTDRVHGREFDAPPNRPNDRELVIGWRASWGDDAGFDAETRNDVGASDSGDGEAGDLDRTIGEEVEKMSKAEERQLKADEEKRQLKVEAEKRLKEAEEKRLAAEQILAERSLVPALPMPPLVPTDPNELARYQVRVARTALLDEQDAAAGGRGRPMKSSRLALQSMRKRGIEIRTAKNVEVKDKPFGTLPNWERLVDAELRSLDRLRWSPQITGIREKADSSEAYASMGGYHSTANRTVSQRLWLRTEGMEYINTLLDAHELRANRVPFLASARMSTAELAKLSAQYGDLGIESDTVSAIAHIIRHEYGHGVEHNLQWLSRSHAVDHLYREAIHADVDALALLNKWNAARDAVSDATWGIGVRPPVSGFQVPTNTDAKGTWYQISEYATTNDREMFAEAFATAMNGGWDDIPVQLHESLREILELAG
jgi:hypothetical protein